MRTSMALQQVQPRRIQRLACRRHGIRRAYSRHRAILDGEEANGAVRRDVYRR
jgi:hypothetical protein